MGNTATVSAWVIGIFVAIAAVVKMREAGLQREMRFFMSWQYFILAVAALAVMAELMMDKAGESSALIYSMYAALFALAAAMNMRKCKFAFGVFYTAVQAFAAIFGGVAVVFLISKVFKLGAGD